MRSHCGEPEGAECGKWGHWGHQTCRERDAGKPHRPHNHNPDWASYGPYWCSGLMDRALLREDEASLTQEIRALTAERRKIRKQLADLGSNQKGR